MPVNDAVVESFKQYLALSRQIADVKALIAPHIEALREAFKGQNFCRTSTMEAFKDNLRIAMQPANENWQDIWARGSLLLRKTNLTAEETILWNKRESIRSQVNLKAREIARKLFHVPGARDPEDFPQRSTADSSGSSSSSTAVQAAPEPRLKRTVQEKPKENIPAPPSMKKRKRRDPYDILMAARDFKPIYSERAKHAAVIEELQALGNRAAKLLKKLGKPANVEWYFDGYDDDDRQKRTQVRFMALKPEFIINARFKDHSTESVAAAPPSADAAIEEDQRDEA